MFLPWTRVAAFVALAAFVVIPKKNLQCKADPITESAENWDFQLVKSRLEALQLPIPVQTNEQVISRIRQYVTTGKTETEAVLGRSELYFPIFEHQLKAYGLPEELKYLPLIESGLMLTIKSPVGARGLWQFMPISATHFGLNMSGGVDERMDIYRSTDAAMRMLKYLYGEFGDWALVLAAYNTGTGKVSEAVRRAGTKDYWKVKDYLPAETQRYVPAFIAAAYISKYHLHHNLRPSNYGSFSTDLRSIRIHQRISFGEIARITGLPLSKLAELNPGFVQGVVPANEKGYYLMLPNEKASLLLRDYLGGTENQKLLKSGDLVRMTYVVSKEHTLEEIAKLFNTDAASIKKWNQLQGDEIAIRQELLLYLPKAFLLNRV